MRPTVCVLTRSARAMACTIESATPTTPQHDAVSHTLDASEGFSLENVQHNSLQRLVQPTIRTLTRSARAMLYAIRSAMPI